MTTSGIEPAAWDALFGECYGELRKLAHGQRGGGHDTLDTTALVHELFLRMNGSDGDRRFGTPRHFYAYAARAMRNLLVDRARARARVKRGGDLQRVELGESAADGLRTDPALALALDAGLRHLAADDARAAEVVELHYFAGLPIERIAEVLEVSPRTVDRDWRYARAFLHSQIGV